MMSFSDGKQAVIIDAFNTTSRYLDDTININTVYFDYMVHHRYPSELQLNNANTFDTNASFNDFHLSISNDIISTKIYDNATIVIFNLSTSHCNMMMFLALHPMESISLSSFV